MQNPIFDKKQDKDQGEEYEPRANPLLQIDTTDLSEFTMKFKENIKDFNSKYYASKK